MVVVLQAQEAGVGASHGLPCREFLVQQVENGLGQVGAWILISEHDALVGYWFDATARIRLNDEVVEAPFNEIGDVTRRQENVRNLLGHDEGVTVAKAKLE